VRCSSDNKFASYDETELDVQSEDLTGNEINYQIHLNRPCSSCGQEAASADLELTLSIDHECGEVDPTDEQYWSNDDIVWTVVGDEANYKTRDEALEAAKGNSYAVGALWNPDEEPEFDLSSSDVEEVDTMQNKDRHGKPITKSRYMKHLIGAHVTAHLSCQRCGEEFDVDGEDTLGASEFEDAGH